MTSDELVKRLQKLSGQECKVLRLRCEALSDKAISEQTKIPLPTVKTYLGRAYIKLDVDGFEKLFRWKVLLDEICPVLKQLDLSVAPEPRKLRPAPDNVVRKVEEDDEILERLGRDELLRFIDVTPLPPPQPQRARWLGLGFAVGLFLGALFVMGIIYWLQPQRGVAGAPTAQAILLPPPSPVVVTATPNPNLPTAMPVVQTAIVPQTVAVPQTVVVAQTVVVPQIVTQTVVVEVTPKPAPVAQAPAGTPSSPTLTPLFFQEEFDGSNLDSVKWEVSGPPIKIKNGTMLLESNLAVFQYMYTKQNPFPTKGNFTFEVSFHYPSVTGPGPGIAAAQAVPQQFGNYGVVANQFFSVIQAGGLPLSVYFKGTRVYASPDIDRGWHTVQFQYDGKYQIFVDDNPVYTSPATDERPSVVWIGNPDNAGGPTQWTSLEIDYVRTRQPK